MKHFLLISILWVTTYVAKAQSGWIKVDLGSGLFISFPGNPEYKFSADAKTGNYKQKTENCFLLAIVQYNIIPSNTYSQFLGYPKRVQDSLINILLDNAAKGNLTMAGQLGNKVEKIQIGNFSGRQFRTNTINPATGQSTPDFIKIIYHSNKLFTIQCKYLENNTEGKSEMSIFLNSIVTTD
jgi:hypothetical protein